MSSTWICHSKHFETPVYEAKLANLRPYPSQTGTTHLISRIIRQGDVDFVLIIGRRSLGSRTTSYVYNRSNFERGKKMRRGRRCNCAVRRYWTRSRARCEFVGNVCNLRTNFKFDGKWNDSMMVHIYRFRIKIKQHLQWQFWLRLKDNRMASNSKFSLTKWDALRAYRKSVTFHWIQRNVRFLMLIPMTILTGSGRKFGFWGVQKIARTGIRPNPCNLRRHYTHLPLHFVREFSSS